MVKIGKVVPVRKPGWGRPVIHDPKKVTPGPRKGREPSDDDYEG